MSRSVVATAREILKVVPESEPLHAELVSFANSIFIELPETMHVEWKKLANVLEEHFPPQEAKLLEWQREVVKIWLGQQSAVETVAELASDSCQWTEGPADVYAMRKYDTACHRSLKSSRAYVGNFHVCPYCANTIKLDIYDDHPHAQSDRGTSLAP